ncbi:hypothetical protein E3N88_24954 [Mikania micrantha]|uniref:Uncharacterized protein n=1 Tax=Mikania micrantha TaxID=192012 RepID=A0A5N6N4S2_9ASTR|nr:hypothetical protein E3N88_24954 [Mikania micrantha]
MLTRPIFLFPPSTTPRVEALFCQEQTEGGGVLLSRATGGCSTVAAEGSGGVLLSRATAGRTVVGGHQAMVRGPSSGRDFELRKIDVRVGETE